MRCDNILCSNDAEFFNVKTNQYKCQNCLGKYLDRHSPTWVKLEQEANEDFPLEAPKLKVKDKYSVVFSHFSQKWFIYCDDEGNFPYSREEEGDAKEICDIMNEAYRRGISDVLSDLESFSLDVRRKNKISWGISSFNPNSNI